MEDLFAGDGSDRAYETSLIAGEPSSVGGPGEEPVARDERGHGVVPFFLGGARE